MSEKWVEHIKTGLLIALVLASFLLTGLLWLNQPGEKRTYNPLDAYTINPIYDEKYNDRKIYQLAAPNQMIVHQKGAHFWLLPEEADYEQLLRSMQSMSVSDMEKMGKVSPDTWKNMFTRFPGVELYFPDEVSLEQADLFFQESLSQHYPMSYLSSVSRIWFFSNPEKKQNFVWFISDQDQQIIQAKTDIDLENLLSKLKHPSSPSLEAVPATGKAPWDPANQDEPFPRMFYLPTRPVSLSEKTYQLEDISADAMIDWLFKDPDVRPIPINKNEDLYMYDEQMMTVNKNNRFMVYSEAVEESPGEIQPVEQRLSAVNNFVQRPHGWTGNYLLDQVDDKENAFSEFTFRLYMNGYPVYWKDRNFIHPDEIKLQTNPVENAVNVNKYERSLFYLTGEPQQKQAALPDKETLIKQLSKHNLSLSNVKRIHPGYQAVTTNQQVRLTPVWVVKTTSGQQVWISSP
ncbi:hypothetical protein H1R82_03510 [Thermoactinomyces intermedius]|uniref:Regulatory protein YycH domain-containing protein n=1 Tax=Thermoactinomyces intermedius TaxID=2024 RepID=A0A8I1DEE9_THEIN|nr:two-component system activity regulator YycH [Thermoactinomyces intermedius]MBA4548070.1 hypothetical protein [Thermoactinomyces intermedius]MBA4835701.1 hypothetical protein [Thermoactinomyces intermedius]MBH8594914.1 hypothetical protein [Thermoactinomyces intermedius]